MLVEERLTENAFDMGHVFRTEVEGMQSPLVRVIRGKGLLNALVIGDDPESSLAKNVCLSMADKGLLAKPTHGNIIRFAPPLTIVDTQMEQALDIIHRSLKEF